MKFITVLFALVCLYASVNAKGDNVGTLRRESPFRQGLRSTSVDNDVVPLTRVRSRTVLQRQQPVLVRQQPIDVSQEEVLVRQQPFEEVLVRRQQPVVVNQDEVLVRREQPVDVSQEEVLVRQQPVEEVLVKRQQPVDVRQEEVVVRRQQPVDVRQEEVVVRKQRPVDVRQEEVVVRKQRPVDVRQEEVVVRKQQPVVVRQEPVVVRKQQTVVQQRPRYTVIRATQAPVEYRPVDEEVPTVEVVNRPSVPRRVRPVTVVVSQEQFEQGADDTEEDVRGNGQQDQQELVQEPVPPATRLVVEQPVKLDVPQQNRRRFNVLLRTADGFNEKAGYSVSNRRTVLN